MDVCPNCHRKLISHLSPRCNWCGKEIADPQYQAQAQVGREVFYAEQAMHEAVSVANLEASLYSSTLPIAQPGWVDPFGLVSRARHQQQAARIAQAQQMAAQAAERAAAARIAAAQSAAGSPPIEQSGGRQQPGGGQQSPQAGSWPVQPTFGTPVGTNTGEYRSESQDAGQDSETPQPANRFNALEL